MKNMLLINMDIVDFLLNADMEKVAGITATCSERSQATAIPTLEDCEQRSDNDFALVLLDNTSKFKKFAMYTPELVELNLAVLSNTHTKIPEELVKIAATNLTASAKKFDITVPEELQKYASDTLGNRYITVNEVNEIDYMDKLLQLEKTASVQHYALSGKLPIDTKAQFEKAASWFEKHYNQLSVDEITEFVHNMKETGNALSTTLEKCAALSNAEFNSDLYTHILMRKNLLAENDTEYREAYDDLLRRADSLGVEKTAAVLEVLDQEADLSHLYGGKIAHPYISVFGELSKVASSDEVDIEGIKITRGMLKKASSDDLSVIVGNDLTRELKGSEGLEIFDSLPTPIKLEICKIL